jgi:hypothetical protein
VATNKPQEAGVQAVVIVNHVVAAEVAAVAIIPEAEAGADEGVVTEAEEGTEAAGPDAKKIEDRQARENGKRAVQGDAQHDQSRGDRVEVAEADGGANHQQNETKVVATAGVPVLKTKWKPHKQEQS